MGLLDNLLGAAGASNLGGGGGAQAALLEQLGSLLQSSGGAGGLLQAFEQGGLGHVFQSWVSSGQNLPISPEQLQSVLGSGQIAQLAESVGLSHADTLQHLSSLLPQVVDHLTPGGQLPADGGFDLGSLGVLAGQLLGNNR